jgi:predicted RNA polymerase sigma factor
MTHSADWIGRSPAIARVNNAEAERWEEDTDQEQIVLLYDMLLHLAASRVTRLHRAIAVRYAAGDAGRRRGVTWKRPVPRRRSCGPGPRAPREW